MSIRWFRTLLKSRIPAASKRSVGKCLSSAADSGHRTPDSGLRTPDFANCLNESLGQTECVFLLGKSGKKWGKWKFRMAKVWTTTIDCDQGSPWWRFLQWMQLRDLPKDKQPKEPHKTKTLITIFLDSTWNSIIVKYLKYFVYRNPDSQTC